LIKPPKLQLGPFVLQEPIGQGAMGVVWRGVHSVQGVPVAVKVLSKKRRWEPAHLDSFRQEVKAMARLHHAGVVMLLDYGAVDRRAARLPGSDLPEGTPFIAMELAEFGSLDRFIQARPGWRTLRAILLGVLEALAHAHARDLVHRDIKPANVLVFGRRYGLPILKLTDFGVAHLHKDHARPGTTEETVGTPNYMAPEQFQGHWRDYGPWTDLYAVGCMAYELAVGAVPFQANTFIEHAYKHMRLAPPSLEVRPELPPALGPWVMRLLEKDPARRFQRAADAIWALELLSEGFDAPPEPEPEPLQSVPSLPHGPDADPQDDTINADTREIWEIQGSLPSPPLHDTSAHPRLEEPDTPHTADPLAPSGLYVVKGGLRQVVQGAGGVAPPIPDDWRYEVHAPPSMQLVGAGLGLYGLRSVPLVGREAERDRLWATLRAVARDAQPALVLLRGASGLGKSRLAEWIAQRAHEVGAAAIFKATHSPLHGPADGLPRMVARKLRCLGLEHGEVVDRLTQLLSLQGVEDPQEIFGLAELITPSSDAELAQGRGLRFQSPTEWYALLQRLFQRISRERPVLLWLDDVQWGNDALGLARFLLQQTARAPLPALLILTARDEALAQRPNEARALEALMASPRAQAMTLAPLDQRERAALVEELLCLEGELAARVEERTGGNPLFAVQLVGDWVQRGVLEVGATGFVLRQGEEGVLPDDIHQVTEQRIELALQHLPASAHTALEIAAVLGQDIDTEEWEAACHRAGVALSEALLSALLDHRLLTPLERGWAFAHGVVRESLERTAREEDRWPLHNLACAYMLEDRFNSVERGLHARLGRHLLEAGEWARAMVYLLQAAEEQAHTGLYARALSSLDRHDRAALQAKITDQDERFGESCNLRAEVLKRQGRLPEARALAQHVAHEAQRRSWSRALPEALRLQGDVACIQGQMAEASALYQRALELYAAHRDVPRQAAMLTGLADVDRQTGALLKARARYKESLLLCEALSLPRQRALNLQGLGLTAYQRGDDDEAAAYLEEARALFTQRGERSYAVDCGLYLADVSRQRGALDEAQAQLQRALDVYEAIGSGHAVHARLSMGLLHLREGRWHHAEAALKTCLAIFEDTGELDDIGRASAALLVSAAALGQWDDWDAHLERARQALEQTARADRDVAQSLERAAQVTQAAHPDRAHLALALAHRQRALLQPA
jgi:serine/threonine protein kinase/predicted ATPase